MGKLTVDTDLQSQFNNLGIQLEEYSKINIDFSNKDSVEQAKVVYDSLRGSINSVKQSVIELNKEQSKPSNVVLSKESFEEFKNIQLEPLKLKLEIEKLDNSDVEQRTKLFGDLAVAQDKAKTLARESNLSEEQKNDILRSQAALEQEIVQIKKSAQNQSYIQNFAKQAKEITGVGKLINNEQFNDAKEKLQELEALKVSLSEMGLNDKQLGQISDIFNKAKVPIDQYTKDVENAEKGISDLILKFEAFKLKASAAVIDPTLAPTIKKLGDDLYAAQGKATPEAYNQLNAAFKTVDLSAKAVGKNVLSMVDLITQGFKKLGSYMINRVIFSQLQNSLSMIYKNVVDLEFAMKDLERISGISGSQMSEVFDRAAESAIKLGVSVKDVLGSLGEFSRLGMDIESSFELMNAATLLSTTGVISLERSTKGLISATQAYGISAKDTMQLVDEIIATDISNAISAEGILDILERSSASLASTGSTIQTNIALGTALQSVLQNSEKAGTALNRITQRLRSTTGALQELGETDLEGTFTSITRLQERIYELTNYKVDIMLDKDTFKDVADIIREIGQVLPTLTDIQTAEIVQILGGAQQAQAASALLNQYHLIDESLESMGASAGVAQKMNDVMLDSAKMKSEQLGASFEKLSQSAIDTIFIKGGLDSLRGLVEFITFINKSTGGLLSAGVAFSTLATGFKALNQKFEFGKMFTGLADIQLFNRMSFGNIGRGIIATRIFALVG